MLHDAAAALQGMMMHCPDEHRHNTLAVGPTTPVIADRCMTSSLCRLALQDGQQQHGAAAPGCAGVSSEDAAGGVCVQQLHHRLLRCSRSRHNGEPASHPHGAVHVTLLSSGLTAVGSVEGRALSPVPAANTTLALAQSYHGVLVPCRVCSWRA